MSHSRCLVVGNGRALDPDDFMALAKGACVYAIDGAYQTLKLWSVTPNYLSGDFDSVGLSVMELQTELPNTQVIDTPDQNFTDLEKALEIIANLGFDTVDLCHCIGDRMDHNINALAMLKYPVSKRLSQPITLYTETEKILAISDCSIVLNGCIGAHVAILGHPKATISSKGLMYDMQALQLEHLVKHSGSNTLTHTRANLEVHGSALLCLGKTVIASVIGMSPPPL